jgi:alkaline phosphatase D
VATDAGLRKVVATTVVPTGAGLDGALKARVGGLRPATEYFYAWESGTDVSPIGRTRTAPPADSAQPLRFAFSSCQQYALGHFGAHAHAATAGELDLYLFLGDYIYEKGTPSGQIVRPDGIDAVDLASYRRKYQLYRSDPGLRELHRLHPAAHVWDDHEVANNYTNYNPPAAPAQRFAGYRAAFEWLPRMTFPSERHRIFKKLSFGTLADVFLLDERQYRTGQVADGQPRRMLGDAQLTWLVESLKASPATWKIVAQQVVVASGLRGSELNDDAWDGYPEDRVRILGEIERVSVPNVVFLTGDAHVFMANLLAADFSTFGDGTGRRPDAVEYVGGSVTSPGADLAEWGVQEIAPWNRQYDGFRHGYAYLNVTPELLMTEYRATNRTVPNAPTVAFERFTQPVGTNQLERHGV